MHQKDSVNSEIVYNWTEFEKTKDKIQLRKLEVNKSKKLCFVQYEKFGVAGDFIEIFPFGKNEPIDSIKNVYESQWLNNSQIIYVESDYTRRGGELYLYDIETKKKTFLYKENDKTNWWNNT